MTPNPFIERTCTGNQNPVAIGPLTDQSLGFFVPSFVRVATISSTLIARAPSQRSIGLAFTVIAVAIISLRLTSRSNRSRASAVVHSTKNQNRRLEGAACHLTGRSTRASRLRRSTAQRH